MELYVVLYIIFLGLTGFFTAYQFGLTWPYSSEAGGREHRLNIIAAIASGLAFFFMVLFILIIIAIALDWVDDWINIFRTEMNWIVGIVGSIALIFGAWAIFWRMNEKQNQFHEFMEKAANHFNVKENVLSAHHPYRADFAFMKWSRPEYTSVPDSPNRYSRRSRRVNVSIDRPVMPKSKPSSKSSNKSNKKRSKNSGLGQLFILFIIIIIAALTAYTLVHFIAKWAIGIEEDWIRQKRGWANSDLLPAKPAI